MASVSGNMKGFYRQKKKANSSAKSSAKSSTSSKKSLTLASDVTQSPALVDLKDDVNEYEGMLRHFDLNMAYGPCLGMTRLARWERARKLGLNPPEEIEVLLKGGKVQTDCLWDGRI